MQPLLTQVPPNRLRSIIATFIPVSASRTARDGPAWPVPITIASYLAAIGIPPLGLQSSIIFQGSYQPLMFRFDPNRKSFWIAGAALRVTEAKPLINANGREWKRMKRGCFTVAQRERESPHKGSF